MMQQFWHYGSYVLWACIFAVLYWLSQKQRKNWIERYNIVFYDDIKDITLCRILIKDMMTDAFCHEEEIEVTVFSQGVFFRFPYQTFPMWKLQIEHIEKVRKTPGEVIIYADRPLSVSKQTIIHSDTESDLTELVKQIEFLIKRYKEKQRQPESLLKKKI